MKYFIIFIFLVLGVNRSAFSLALRERDKTPKSFYQIKDVVGKIKNQTFRRRIHEFVKASRPNRFPGTPGHKGAVKWLIDSIKKLDPGGKNILVVNEFNPDIEHAVSLYKQDFQREVVAHYKPDSPIYQTWKGFTDNMVQTLEKFRNFKGRNIIWEKKGFLNPEEVIVVGAHYDTIANDPQTKRLKLDTEMPGADDNASAVIVALSIIELLSEINLPKTVRVVFFDFEELGFLGSRAYVQKYKKEMLSSKNKLAGYVNLEMLGNDTKRDDKLKKHGNMKLYIRKLGETGHLQDKKLAQLLTRNGEKITTSVNFEIVANSFNSSDNINFWEAGIPAVTFTQDWENDFNKKRYHSANDFVETLNIKTLYNSYKYIAGALIAWAFDIL